MKKTLRFNVLIGAAALIALALTGCSNSGSHGRYFSYVQNTIASSVTPPAAQHQAHAAVQHVAVTAVRAFPARTVVISGITPRAGNQDLYIYDTATQTTKDVFPGFDIYSTQISHNDRLIVSSILTPIAEGSGIDYFQLWVADRDGKTITQITTDANNHYDATFSADGSMIAYYAYDSILGLYQLFTIPAAGGTATEIIFTDQPTLAAFQPVFTPDGLNLVFVGSTNDFFDEAIGIVKLSTGVVTQLSEPQTDSVTIHQRDYAPSVSPDGTQVSFTRGTETFGTPNTYAYDIYVMPITGEPTVDSATGLTTGLVTAGDSYQPMYLDNANENIVYLSGEPNSATTDNANIFEMNRDGSITGLAKTQLTSSPFAEYFN